MYIHKFNPLGEPPPEEWIELKKCQMYGCTPDELDKLDARTVELHWVLHNEEQRIINLLQAKANKPKGKGHKVMGSFGG